MQVSCDILCLFFFWDEKIKELWYEEYHQTFQKLTKDLFEEHK